MSVNVNLLEARETRAGYTATIEVTYEGKAYPLRITRLARRPAKLKHEVKGDYLHIYLLDEDGDGIGTCCIHIKHLEKGCLDCPSLVLPPED
ncbi:MAG: hypothetical protein F7C81_02900 [Desulfurococcales archaeon]|nr:hypothetical protein [Desulfurococcales archaeon]